MRKSSLADISILWPRTEILRVKFLAKCIVHDSHKTCKYRAILVSRFLLIAILGLLLIALARERNLLISSEPPNFITRLVTVKLLPQNYCLNL